MTEYWKSNPMFWCEYCKVWMQDKPSARATHEKGIKHKDNVARKLRDMRLKSDREVKEGKQAEATMGDIDARARKQYDEDLKAAKQARADAAGEWVYDEESKLQYNARHRYYYNERTQMYYGGEPPAWTVEPPLPAEARFPAALAPSSSDPQTTPGMSAPAISRTAKPAAAASRAKRDEHPLGQLGGYQMPSFGAIGGAKGIGVQGAGSAAAQTKKRTAEHSHAGDRKVSAEEAAALARREAARQRVNNRTMSAFGLK